MTQFKNNQIPLVYETDSNKPIYVDKETGNVWQRGMPKGGIMLPEVRVTRPKYSSAYDGNAIRPILDWVPGVDVAMLGVDVADNIQSAKYTEAGWSIVPAIIGETLAKTKWGKLLPKKLKYNILGNLLNKQIKNTVLWKETAKVPIEKGYMYHKSPKPAYLGYVKNGKHYNLDRPPGQVRIKDGKYESVRFQGDNPQDDRIWWDTNGYNQGSQVLVTKEGGFKLSDPRSKAIPGRGVYQDTYRTTYRPNVNSVVRFDYDPLLNTYRAYSPFKSITTNKMSLNELFQHE